MEYANGQMISVSEKEMSSGGCLPLPRGYMTEWILERGSVKIPLIL